MSSPAQRPMKDLPPIKRELCPHIGFAAEVQVARVRLKSGMKFMAEIQIARSHCGVRFRFKGLDQGLDYGEPMTDVSGFELRAPIEADAHLTSMMAEAAE